jgi:hypothetical protein
VGSVVSGLDQPDFVPAEISGSGVRDALMRPVSAVEQFELAHGGE